MNVSENVKRIVNDKGLKYRFVAEKAGYDRKTFSNIINGRKVVREEDIVRLCCALGVKPNELFKEQL